MPKPKRRTLQFALKILLRIILVLIALGSLITTLFGLFVLINSPDELYARTETKWLLFPDSRIEFYALYIHVIVDAIILEVASCICLFVKNVRKKLNGVIWCESIELFLAAFGFTYKFIAIKSLPTDMLYDVAVPLFILFFCLLWKKKRIAAK